jgi:Asp-tRNA(Asn)/Glu-tRNA(Gln) amidotransferase C subunit
MDVLNTVNTDNVEPTSHAVPVDCVLREDIVKDSFAVDDSFFKVPPIIEVEE